MSEEEKSSAEDNAGHKRRDFIDMRLKDRREVYELCLGLAMVFGFFALATGIYHHWVANSLAAQLLTESRERDLDTHAHLRRALDQSEEIRKALHTYVDTLSAHVEDGSPISAEEREKILADWKAVEKEFSKPGAVKLAWTQESERDSRDSLDVWYKEREFDSDLMGVTFAIHIVLATFCVGFGLGALAVYATRRHKELDARDAAKERARQLAKRE